MLPLLGMLGIALMYAIPVQAHANMQAKATQSTHNTKSAERAKTTNAIRTSISNSIGTLTLALDNANDTFVYGQPPTPIFTVTLVFSVKQTRNPLRTAQVTMDSGETFGGTLNYINNDGVTLVARVDTRGSAIIAGQRTAVASFTDAPTNTTIQSAPITFTINRAVVDFYCGVPNTQLSPGQSVVVAMSYQYTVNPPPSPVDWKHVTYSITFTGPTTLSYSNLAPDANDDVTVQLPSQIGNYSYTCTYSGTPLYLPESMVSNAPIQISEKRALAGVKLYTNPTTLVAGQPADFYIVLPAAPGVPAPTGQVEFYMGQYYTTSFYLTNGTLSLHFDAIPPLQGITSINVTYYGDIHYAVSYFRFSLTNPPIPSGASGPQATVGSTAKATGTVTPGATVAATATATTTLVSATPTVTSATNPASRTTGSNAGVFLLVGILILLLLAGGATGLVLWRRHIKPTEIGAMLQEAASPVLSSADAPEQAIPPKSDTVL